LYDSRSSVSKARFPSPGGSTAITLHSTSSASSSGISQTWRRARGSEADTRLQERAQRWSGKRFCIRRRWSDIHSFVRRSTRREKRGGAAHLGRNPLEQLRAERHAARGGAPAQQVVEVLHDQLAALDELRPKKSRSKTARRGGGADASRAEGSERVR